MAKTKCAKICGWTQLVYNGPGYPSGGVGRQLRKLACAASGSNFVACDSEGLGAAESFSSVFFVWIKCSKNFPITDSAAARG
ncbi:MAG: hypothetical protein CMC74_05915 [Flavobacteriaceae bacterium]|nr:hypothetical protein [Flavobacteriaceae bacterium]